MMERTREETALRALRLIGVVATDEPGSADQMQGALMVLDSIWTEVRDEAQATWDIATGVPQDAFVPLANLLAAELAGEYAVPSPMSRARAKLRLLAVIRKTEPRECCDYDPCADYGAGARVVIIGGDNTPSGWDAGNPVYDVS
ncbi:hypothetical protein NM680_12950 [Paracoccus sp. PS-1]|uniref:hypothetical protein n=1 Tax=Paracoccus sp. PS1 TaxID=2963938 RepID=UPI0027E5942A|nr:hypothetical protein [Paracoccus sp. PS1]MDQ7262700.1 hypothetical protein [Paracoccus sp. PS1]